MLDRIAAALTAQSAAPDPVEIEADSTSTAAAGFREGFDPDLEDTLAASVERTQHAGDGPDVPPVWYPPRELVDETHRMLAALHDVRSVLLRPPAPSTSTSMRLNRPAAEAGISTQVVPPAEGRSRRVTVQIVSGTAYLSTDRLDNGSATSGDLTGYMLDDGTNLSDAVTFTTSTTAAIYATSNGAYDLRVWIDHYNAET